MRTIALQSTSTFVLSIQSSVNAAPRRNTPGTSGCPLFRVSQVPAAPDSHDERGERRLSTGLISLDRTDW